MDTKSHRINFTQKRKAEDGQWRFYPVQWNGNKPDPRLILINGEPASWEKGRAFYLDSRENGKRRRKKIGTKPREALGAWRNATGMANGSIPKDEDEKTDDSTDSPGISLEAGITLYLEAVKATKGNGTYGSYKACLTWAKSRLKKLLVNRLNRNDLLGLFFSGRKEGLDQKTINKRVTVVLNMARHHDHDINLKKGDWPKTSDKPIEVYTEEEMQKFFAASSDDERLLFQVFLCTGFRDKEVVYLMWSDIDYRRSKIRVTAKTDLKFSPKSYEIRSVDVPGSLLDSLGFVELGRFSIQYRERFGETPRETLNRGRGYAGLS